VTLSGGLSHLVADEVGERYCALVRALVHEQRALGSGPTVTTNPQLAGATAALGWDTRSLSFDDAHVALGRAPLALSPAGLTTTLEAAALGTPIVFLPEQHDGHGLNVDLVNGQGGGRPYADVLLRRWFDLCGGGPQQAIAEIDEVVSSLLAPEGAERLAAMHSHLATVLDALASPTDRTRVAAAQRARVEQVVGSFDGATAAASVVDRLVGGVGRPAAVRQLTTGP